ncbi:hypothetical protein AVEN_183218-1 [Araneus ventricosus]|uniref:RNase H type-1 domain-containing protein n=1 Tax=Araneus ventricosus TaxID=182803 RepID=A0A4Y2KRY9_ARAVE|nr:hypothetical protein AVEN_183218-1 [Araneus ventricosus]
MGPLKDVPLSGQQTCKTYLAFFILKRISAENNFHTVSPFLVEETISESVGVVKSIRKLRSGDLLIEVSSRKQANQVMKLKALSKIPVSVGPHRSLNFSKGVISSGELFNDETYVILYKLSSQGVTEVRRITIKKDGVIFKTKHLVLIFRSSKLPQFIKAGYIRYAIRPYIPNPLRCFQCQRLGHAKASCLGTLTCARCVELGHDDTDCKGEVKCVNCKGKISICNDKKWIIYTDSRSCLEALLHISRRSHPLVNKIFNLYTSLLEKGYNISFCWIPGHIRIVGNEKADIAAKEARRIKWPYVPLPDIDGILKSEVSRSRQEIWNIQVNNKLHYIQPSVGGFKPCNFNRNIDVKLVRQRIGHTYFTHRYLLHSEPAPICQTCNANFTQILSECDIFYCRIKWFGKAHPQLHELLGGPPHFNLFSFVAEIGFMKVI